MGAVGGIAAWPPFTRINLYRSVYKYLRCEYCSMARTTRALTAVPAASLDALAFETADRRARASQYVSKPIA